jgi:colanic acid biosynthesis glycosyl transferase WcaI
VELDRIAPSAGRSPLRREWGIAEEDIVILYSGNMGEKQGLEIIIDAAHLLSSYRDIRFVICGDGAARPRLEQAAAGLSNVEFKPLQPAERLNDLLALADVHVLPQRADAADLVLPSKLTNMMASARPVVATAAQGTQVADLVGDCGIVVAPGDARGLADAVASLAGSLERRKSLGKRGRELAQQLWDKEAVLSAAFDPRRWLAET